MKGVMHYEFIEFWPEFFAKLLLIRNTINNNLYLNDAYCIGAKKTLYWQRKQASDFTALHSCTSKGTI